MQRFLTDEGAALIIWRQSGDAIVPRTLAPRDHHRRVVSDENGIRFYVAPPAAISGFNPAWARNSNTVMKAA